MTEYLIGTGGWAYLSVPGLPSLVAYSRLFNFVEVNSTFYVVPNIKTAEFWRRRVPPEFEFSVRCNRTVTHKYQLQPKDEVYDIFHKMVKICKTLRSEILHMQTPPIFKSNRDNAELLRTLMSSVDLKGVRLALEVRGANQALDPEFVKVMQDHNMIHSVDLSKDEQPAYKSDILYSRLFGKGEHNIYQPTDQELKKIDDRASSKEYRKVMVSFHFVRMHKDATRLKMYKETGKFPMVTKSTGLKSLEEILKEDAKFPSTKEGLIRHQGWKLIDLSEEERVRSSDMLQKLPEKTYYSVNDVIQALKGF